jgi:putative endonuclease
MAWFLYLIECTDGSIYTGIAVDVAARYAKHMSGAGARYTRSHKPQRLLASFEMPDRAAASRAEYRVKRLSPGAKRALAGGAADTAGAPLYAPDAADPGIPAPAGP